MRTPYPPPPRIYIYKKFKYSKLPLSQTRRDRQDIKYWGQEGSMENRTKRAEVEGLKSVGTGGRGMAGPPQCQELII